METLRHRVPFNVSSDEDGMNPEDDERHVMDEQEQQDFIQSLRRAEQTADKAYVQALRIIIVFSVILQMVFLSTLIAHSGARTVATPLSTFFTTPPRPLIPLPVVLTIYAVVLQCLEAFTLSPFTRLTEVLLVRGYRIPGIFLYLIAPAISISTGRDFPQTLWWAEPTILIGLVTLMQHWMRSTARGVEELEGLKYSAQGA